MEPGSASKPRVLLVDAVPDEQAMYADVLRIAGFDPEVCATGARAVEALDTESVAAVIARIRQHGTIDGIELTRMIRANAATRHIPVILITTHIEPSIHAEALTAGCNRLLLLPQTPMRLVTELRHQLRSSDSAI